MVWSLLNPHFGSQVYILGGDGTQKGAAAIFEVMHIGLVICKLVEYLKIEEL